MTIQEGSIDFDQGIGMEQKNVTSKQVQKKTPDPKIEQAVRWLQGCKARMENELTLFAKEIGDYLIEEFFEDDPDLVSSQNPNKNFSFRKLCNEPGLPFSESSLRRFIQVAVNFRILPKEKAQKLLPSHHVVLYQVADPDERKQVGIEAADNQVSVRKLRKMVQGKGRRRPGGGRKPDSEFIKGWRQLVSLVESLSTEADKYDCSDLCKLGDTGTECEKIRKKMARIMDKVVGLDDNDEDFSDTK